jgi:hypothetical protein
MNQFKNYVLMAGGFALVATVVGVFTAGPAIAQALRAALVSNVDDPGRIPYAVSVSCDFDKQLCLTAIPPVPNGKRLVITHVSGGVQENLPGGTFLAVSVHTGHTNAYIVPTYIGIQFGNSFVFDQSVLLFADPGERPPFAQVELGGVPSGASGASFNLSGYMLDCSNGPCAKVAP